MILKLSFQTCTLAEAVDEINLVLKPANLPEISESDLISTTKCSTEPDDFEDYRFTFGLKLNDNVDSNSIIEKLSHKGIDIDTE